jgi:hypothetical protein
LLEGLMIIEAGSGGGRSSTVKPRCAVSFTGFEGRSSSLIPRDFLAVFDALSFFFGIGLKQSVAYIFKTRASANARTPQRKVTRLMILSIGKVRDAKPPALPKSTVIFSSSPEHRSASSIAILVFLIASALEYIEQRTEAMAKNHPDHATYKSHG